MEKVDKVDEVDEMDKVDKDKVNKVYKVDKDKVDKDKVEFLHSSISQTFLELSSSFCSNQLLTMPAKLFLQ